MQFTLVLSWTCTAHKLKGHSLQCRATSFSLQRQKSFNQRQMYIALSGIRSLENMYLIGKYTPSVIRANQAAKEEYERLRKKNLFTPLPFFQIKKEIVTLTLLNLSSLSRHAGYITNDKQLQ